MVSPSEIPVSDNFEQLINQKIFHSEIVVDNEKVAAETNAYQKIPQIRTFTDEQGNDSMKASIQENYRQIKHDILQVINDEMERISNDPNLQHLIMKD